MAFNDKLKKLMGQDDTATNEDIKEEEYYKVSREEYEDENGVAGSKMMLLEPRAYSESQRIVDFLSGTLYAIGGDLQKLGGGIFLCTPNNVNVEGKITDDVPAKTSGKKSKQEEDDEFDW